MQRQPTGQIARARSPGRILGRLLGALSIAATLGCSNNPGEDPPSDRVAFPSGLLVDPRVPETEPARWLFVTNANSDRRFNGGSLLAIDLDAFWDNATGAVGEIQPAGTELPDEAGNVCRRIANMPQTVECLEEPFVANPDATVFVGNFPGPATAWVRDGDRARLLIPVRGDPSITYVDVSGDPHGDVSFECGQGEGNRCGDANRLRFYRNDEDSTRLSREPFRVLVSESLETPLAYVSHQGDPDVTLIALDGVHAGDGSPAIIHQANLLGLADFSVNFQGGFGLAERPCDVEAAPNSTIGCSRPLVYGALRHLPQLQLMTAVNHYEPGLESAGACVDGQDVQLGDPGAFVCDPQAEPVRRVDAGGLPQTLSPASSRPYLGDIGFSRTGDELYVVQSNPGALLRVDTSVDVDGNTVDLPAGLVEVCSDPTSLAIYSDPEEGVEYGVVTCYRSGEVFIVDLASLTVVGLSRAGIGPDAIAVDLAREVIYVANTLDATISVISMAESSPSRFTEIARIGLQEPYV